MALIRTNKIWKTKKDCEIHQISLRTNNVILIKCNHYNILVDAGSKNSETNLLNYLNLLNCKLCRIDLLVLTHAHYDHCINAATIKKIYDCKIVCGYQEANYLKNGYRPLPKGTIWLTKNLISFSKIAPKGFIQSRFSYKPVIADMLISERYQLPTSKNTIEILPTPGHTDGSISVVIDNEIALIGDAAFGLSRKTIFPPFADNSFQLIKSWSVLLKTNCRLFIPAHGSPIYRKRLQDEFDKYKLRIN